jgi:hypothetical protein
MMNKGTTLNSAEFIFGDLMKGFIDTQSVSYVNYKTSMIIWDKILISKSVNPPEILVALSLIMKHLSPDLMLSKNMADLVMTFKEKSLLMHEYDFYLSLFDYYKDKNTHQVDPIQSARTDEAKLQFPHLQNVVAAGLKTRLQGK